MVRRYITIEEQEIIIQRARGRCEYCQSSMNYAMQSFVCEHVIPLSRAGETTLENLALACGGCNGHKYNKVEASDPFDGQIVPLYNPRQERWLDHFGWNEDFTYVIGLTPTGRATVESLKLNRPGVVNMRRLLRAVGIHPPNFAENE